MILLDQAFLFIPIAGVDMNIRLEVFFLAAFGVDVDFDIALAVLAGLVGPKYGAYGHVRNGWFG